MKKNIRLPGFKVPKSYIYSYPTRLIDTWAPKSEKICLPSYKVPNQYFQLVVEKGETSTLKEMIRNEKRWRTRSGLLLKSFFNNSPEDVDDNYIFDARLSTVENMTLLLREVIAYYLFAKQAIEREEGKLITLYLLVSAPAKPMLVELTNYLDIPLIISNGRVLGKKVRYIKKGTDRNERYLLYSLLANISFKDYLEDTPKKIFLSRKNTRKLINENEVEFYLRDKGFKKVYFEDIPISTQWSIMRNVDELVAIHGAGTGNLAFHSRFTQGLLPTRLKVTELFPSTLMVDPFRKLSAALNASWCGVRGKITTEGLSLSYKNIGDIDFAYQDFEISLESLELALKFHNLY